LAQLGLGRTPRQTHTNKIQKEAGSGAAEAAGFVRSLAFCNPLLFLFLLSLSISFPLVDFHYRNSFYWGAFHGFLASFYSCMESTVFALIDYRSPLLIE
jgi:hypothetical protein